MRLYIDFLVIYWLIYVFNSSTCTSVFSPIVGKKSHQYNDRVGDIDVIVDIKEIDSDWKKYSLWFSEIEENKQIEYFQ